MTPAQFLRDIARQPAPVYLFLGPDPYERKRCRAALVERLLPVEEREDGFTRHDLDEIDLAAVFDDACSLSLFASTRVIWIASAESALPRKIAAAESSAEDGKESSDAPLKAYLANPSPGVTLVFDACRFDFEGEDKTRLERVRKFYAAIPSLVEFPRFSPDAARELARNLAKAAGLKIGAAEIEMLVEAVGADAARVATEIEKLRLWAGDSGKIEPADLAALIPDARSSTIFALVSALGRSDRKSALDILDTLLRDGEYIPLALNFLATQFRLALVAREAGLRNSAQIQAHFTKAGVPMWRSRAEQVAQTVAAFSKEKLEKAIARVYQADKALRDARPDDRVVIEEFVLEVTR
jgi:DNA polymerase-3 subunit delta